MYRPLSLLLVLFSVALTLHSQSKITIEDRQQLLSQEVKSTLVSKFQEIDLDFTNLVDFTAKCDYHFAAISQVENEVVFQVEDCDGKILGKKSLSATLLDAATEEQAIVYFYNIKSIIESPASSNPYFQQLEAETPLLSEPIEAQHDSRYFFGPTAYNLKKGEFYYNSLYFLVHDIHVGLHDQFSIGAGSTIGGFPFYATAKGSFKLGEKTNLAIGDLVMVGTYNSDFFGNLVFSTVTRGSKETNVTLGVGLLSTTGGELINETTSIAYNLGGIFKLSDFLYVVSENYVFGYNTIETASFFGDDFTATFEERFNLRDHLWVGITGLRLVRKKNQLESWQFGFAYFMRALSDYPDRYKADGWNVSRSPGGDLIAFPMFSYTLKFQL